MLTGWLVLSELFRAPTCPLLLGIPACYIVLAGYVAALAGAWIPDAKVGSVAFLTGAGVVTFVGAWFSFNELTGAIECPSFEGLPMCFVSLFAGATLLALESFRRARQSEIGT
jgi:hypothetical protein